MRRTHWLKAAFAIGLCCLCLGFLEILIEALPVHPELTRQNPVDKETDVWGGGGEKKRGREWEVGEVNNSVNNRGLLFRVPREASQAMIKPVIIIVMDIR